jgi:hypothetical protein
MPRSGSTLLCNILNMNSNFHATPTSPLLDVVRNMRSTFSHNFTFKTHNRLENVENFKRATKSFIENYFDPKNEVVFDKSRSWTTNLMLIDEILGHKETKVIWTYRDPVEIVSSIEKRYRDTVMFESIDEAAGADFSTLGARVDTFIRDGGIVADPVWMLEDAINMGYGDRIMIVRYGDLCINTQSVMENIHSFIDEPLYKYDKYGFSDLTQSTFEFDGLYNYKFSHDIKEGSIKYVKHDVILTERHIENINQRFSWINSLAMNIS